MSLTSILKTVREYFSLELKRDPSILISVTEDGQYTYNLSPNLTPELLAEIIVRVALVTDASQIVKLLEANGYKDAIYRMRNGVSNSMENILGDVLSSVDGKDKKLSTAKIEIPNNNTDNDRPAVEALY